MASAPSQGSFAVVRFAPQATAAEITNFLGAHKATLVEGPLRAGSIYRIRLADTQLPADEVSKIIQADAVGVEGRGFRCPGGGTAAMNALRSAGTTAAPAAVFTAPGADGEAPLRIGAEHGVTLVLAT